MYTSPLMTPTLHRPHPQPPSTGTSTGQPALSINKPPATPPPSTPLLPPGFLDGTIFGKLWSLLSGRGPVGIGE